MKQILEFSFIFLVYTKPQIFLSGECLRKKGAIRGKDFNGIVNVLFGSVLLDTGWKLNLLLKAFTYSKFSVIDLILL